MLTNIKYMFRSLYDKKVAHDFVKKDSKNKGIWFLLIFSVLVTAFMYIRVSRLWPVLKTEMAPIVKEFPDLTVKDGVISFKEKKKTEMLLKSESGNFSVGINTKAKYADFNGQKDLVFIGRDFISFIDPTSAGNISVHYPVEMREISRPVIEQAMMIFERVIRVGLPIALYITVIVGYFLTALVCALVLMAVASFKKIKSTFLQNYKLSLLAFMPGLVIELLLSAVMSSGMLRSFTVFTLYVLFALYFFFALHGKGSNAREAVIELKVKDAKATPAKKAQAKKPVAKKKVTKGKGKK